MDDHPEDEPQASARKRRREPKGETSAARPDKLAVLERRAKAVRARRSGWSYEAIARAYGYSNRGAAYKAVIAAITLEIREPAEELRTLELMRLDRLYLALSKKARAGDTRAIDSCIRIMDRRARLLGLDKARGNDHDDELNCRDAVLLEAEARAATHSPDRPPLDRYPDEPRQ